jgi:hypothetical protein
MLSSPGAAGEEAEYDRFQPLDVFQVEHTSDPRISPDGKRIIGQRQPFRDILESSNRLNEGLGVSQRSTRHGDAPCRRRFRV